jgi:hypothetical protein
VTAGGTGRGADVPNRKEYKPGAGSRMSAAAPAAPDPTRG